MTPVPFGTQTSIVPVQPSMMVPSQAVCVVQTPPNTGLEKVNSDRIVRMERNIESFKNELEWRLNNSEVRSVQNEVHQMRHRLQQYGDNFAALIKQLDRFAKEVSTSIPIGEVQHSISEIEATIRQQHESILKATACQLSLDMRQDEVVASMATLDQIRSLHTIISEVRSDIRALDDRCSSTHVGLEDHTRFVQSTEQHLSTIATDLSNHKDRFDKLDGMIRKLDSGVKRELTSVNQRTIDLEIHLGGQIKSLGEAQKKHSDTLAHVTSELQTITTGQSRQDSAVAHHTDVIRRLASDLQQIRTELRTVRAVAARISQSPPTAAPGSLNQLSCEETASQPNHRCPTWLNNSILSRRRCWIPLIILAVAVFLG